MQGRHFSKNADKPLSFSQAPRLIGNQTPFRGNLLLISGVMLVIVAATMVISTMFS